MAKKYIVDLSEDEVSQLQTLIKTGKHKARIITRVHILLMASEGKTDKTIAEALRIHVSTALAYSRGICTWGSRLHLKRSPSSAQAP
jgi:DNA-binding NarL/FixJ family response regulator